MSSLPLPDRFVLQYARVYCQPTTKNTAALAMNSLETLFGVSKMNFLIRE